MKNYIQIPTSTWIWCLPLCILLLMVALPIQAQNKNQYAIFSLHSDVESLNKSKARKLYRGKTRSLSGENFELSDWPEGSPERASFYRALLNKNISQMNAHWASLSFTGKARPPVVINYPNMDSLMTWMKEKPNRIGYAPMANIPKDAHILYILNLEK